MDFTDAAHPYEIAYFDRGPVDAKTVILGGDWSAYWYNGHIYGSEIARGIDVFKLVPSKFLTQNEIDAANLVQFERTQRAEPATNYMAFQPDHCTRLPGPVSALAGAPLEAGRRSQQGDCACAEIAP